MLAINFIATEKRARRITMAFLVSVLPFHEICGCVRIIIKILCGPQGG